MFVSSNPLRAWIEHKGRGRAYLLSLELGHTSSPALWTWTKLHPWLSWFSSLQKADPVLDSLASIIMGAKFHNLSLSLFLSLSLPKYISCWCRFSGEYNNNFLCIKVVPLPDSWAVNTLWYNLPKCSLYCLHKPVKSFKVFLLLGPWGRELEKNAEFAKTNRTADLFPSLR